MSSLNFSVVIEGGSRGVVIIRSTNLSTGRLATLREKLTSMKEGGVTDFVFDLAEVDYVDTAALGLLMGLYKRVRQRGSVTLINSNQDLRNLFELTGVNQFLVIK